jgi:hypothetical protein
MAARVERNVVKPPNEDGFKRDCRNNGFLPLKGTVCGTGDEPNLSRFMHGDPGGSSGLVRSTPGIMTTPNDSQFREGDKGLAADDQPKFPNMPGKGAVPVNPFLATGKIAPTMPVFEEARARGGR